MWDKINELAGGLSDLADDLGVSKKRLAMVSAITAVATISAMNNPAQSNTSIFSPKTFSPQNHQVKLLDRNERFAIEHSASLSEYQNPYESGNVILVANGDFFKNLDINDIDSFPEDWHSFIEYGYSDLEDDDYKGPHLAYGNSMNCKNSAFTSSTIIDGVQCIASINWDDIHQLYEDKYVGNGVSADQLAELIIDHELFHAHTLFNLEKLSYDNKLESRLTAEKLADIGALIAFHQKNSFNDFTNMALAHTKNRIISGHDEYHTQLDLHVTHALIAKNKEYYQNLNANDIAAEAYAIYQTINRLSASNELNKIFDAYKAGYGLPSDLGKLTSFLLDVSTRSSEKSALTKALGYSPFSITTLSYDETLDLIINNIDLVDTHIANSKAKLDMKFVYNIPTEVPVEQLNLDVVNQTLELTREQIKTAKNGEVKFDRTDVREFIDKTIGKRQSTAPSQSHQHNFDL